MGFGPEANAAVSEVALSEARRHTRTTDRRGYRPAPFVSDYVLGVRRLWANGKSLAITAKSSANFGRWASANAGPTALFI